MSNPIEIQRGTPALDLVHKLPEINHSIAALHFKTYTPLPMLEERLIASTDQPIQDILQQASAIRAAAKKNLVPYWESVLMAASATDKTDLVMREAVRHEPEDEQAEAFQISVQNLARGALKDRIASVSGNQVTALCSTCTLLDGTCRHIPLMDFRIPPDAHNTQVVKHALTALNHSSGVILQSGRSYHFYGFKLLNEEEWVKFSAKCLLLAPLTDARYIAHRLIEGSGALRITTGIVKPVIPIVECVL